MPPYPFQSEVLAHLCQTFDPAIHPSPVFLCAPTGGGKSAVRDAFAAASPGVTINIAPLLSLSADQHAKLSARKKTLKLISIHYDELRGEAGSLAQLEQHILETATQLSFVIFTSPQMLTDRPESLVFIRKLASLNLLRLVCIDEAHLFTDSGLYFRPEFVKLKTLLFPLLRLPLDRLVCPVLAMTASATNVLVEQLSNMTSLGFACGDNKVFWPTASQMACRRQTIHFHPTSQPLKAFKSMVDRFIKAETKFIYYSNRRIAIKRATAGLRSHIDRSDDTLIHGDIVPIIGTYSREQKFHRTQLFLNPMSLPQDTVADFKAVGCTTTRSLGAAGWDSDTIHLVYSSDLPTSLLSILQEKGRAGRRDGADGTTDHYWACFDLTDYTYLLNRFYRGESATDIELSDFAELDTTLQQYTAQKLTDVLSVLKFFVLPQECQHVFLEQTFANPYLCQAANESLTPCLTLCQYCNDGGKTHKTLGKFCRDGLRCALRLFFFSNEALLEPTLDGNELLAKAIIEYPQSSRKIFGVNSNDKPQRAPVRRLLMILLAAELITVRFVSRDVPDTSSDTEGAVKTETSLLARIPMDANGVPCINDDSLWDLLPLKEPLV